MDLLRLILAIFLPPAGVFRQVGVGGHLWLNILLTLFRWLPGVLHAFYVILKEND